jgi:hypothetical protein
MNTVKIIGLPLGLITKQSLIPIVTNNQTIKITFNNFINSLNNNGIIGHQGSIGPQGPNGVDGVSGVDGQYGPIGPLGLTYIGLWSQTVDYFINDVVTFSSSAYVCINDIIGNPLNINPNLDTGNWSLFASQGVQGLSGLTGLDGPQGPQGSQGPQGPQGIQGVDGIGGSVGPLGLNYVGIWNAINYYNLNDVVNYKGSSYFCVSPIAGNPSNLDPVGNPNWNLLASKGDRGAVGIAGIQGPSIPSGISTGDTIYWNGVSNVYSTNIYNNGGNIGIGSGADITKGKVVIKTSGNIIYGKSSSSSNIFSITNVATGNMNNIFSDNGNGFIYGRFLEPPVGGGLTDDINSIQFLRTNTGFESSKLLNYKTDLSISTSGNARTLVDKAYADSTIFNLYPWIRTNPTTVVNNNSGNVIVNLAKTGITNNEFLLITSNPAFSAITISTSPSGKPFIGVGQLNVTERYDTIIGDRLDSGAALSISRIQTKIKFYIGDPQNNIKAAIWTDNYATNNIVNFNTLTPHNIRFNNTTSNGGVTAITTTLTGSTFNVPVTYSDNYLINASPRTLVDKTYVDKNLFVTTPDVLTTSVNISATTVTNGFGSQDKKTIVIQNDINDILYTINAFDSFGVSIIKAGSGSITFVAGVGRTIVSTNLNMNGYEGSIAKIFSVGTVDYLYISNNTVNPF